jgi:hypothetical protein
MAIVNEGLTKRFENIKKWWVMIKYILLQGKK